jgi:predicted PurR-regulated permease PerM
MERKTFRTAATLICLAAVLFLLILRLDGALAILGQIIHTLKPVFFGFALAFILSRPCNFFDRTYRRLLPRAKSGLTSALAVLTSYVLLLVIIALIFTMILPQLYESVRGLATRIYANLPTMQTAFNDLLTRFNLDSTELVSKLPSLSELAERILNALSSALPHLLSFTGSLFSSSIALITSLVLSVYMLAGRKRLVSQAGRMLRAYAPPSVARTAGSIARLTADTFTNFVSGQLLEAAILGVLCFIGMVALRLAYAPLISVIIAVTAIIPIAGPYIGAIVSALLLVMVSPPQALGFLLFIVILQQLEGNLIYPRVVGSSIGLPGLWVLLAVLIGGGLFGLLGMLLSVPAASVCYTLLRQSVATRLKEEAK